MCLNYGYTPKELTGIGYKIVRKTEIEGVYTSFWPFFNKNGGTMVKKSTHLKSNTFYKVGKLTRAKNTKIAVIADHCIYPAGIHLYVDLMYVYEDLHQKVLKVDDKIVILRCKYFGAYRKNKSQVVCKSVRPIDVI